MQIKNNCLKAGATMGMVSCPQCFTALEYLSPTGVLPSALYCELCEEDVTLFTDKCIGAATIADNGLTINVKTQDAKIN